MRKSKKKLAFTRNLNLQISLKNNKLRKIKKELNDLKLKSFSHFQSVDLEVNTQEEIISDLMEIIALNTNWNALQLRIFSVFNVALLKHFKVPRSKIEHFLKSFNLLSLNNCEIHLKKLVSDDFSSMYTHGRGGKRTMGIYDFYPELEYSARLFALSETSKKEANFNVKTLAKFITDEYKEISKDDTLDSNEFIRSISSCRQDLIRWGCLFGENKQMPYSKGHEEPKVVEYRKQFVKELMDNKDLYYTVCDDNEAFSNNLNKNSLELINQKFDEKKWINWKQPIRLENIKKGTSVRRRILISHDESTFKSGEMCKMRWRFGNNLPFRSKGKGR